MCVLLFFAPRHTLILRSGQRTKVAIHTYTLYRGIAWGVVNHMIMHHFGGPNWGVSMAEFYRRQQIFYQPAGYIHRYYRVYKQDWHVMPKIPATPWLVIIIRYSFYTTGYKGLKPNPVIRVHII